MENVTLITDGSADNRTRKGGWSAIIRTSSTLVELVGWADDTTSNRMELAAAIEGLKSIQVPSNVNLISDSAYLLNSLRLGWYKSWLDDSRRCNRPNLDLWQQLAGLVQYHNIRCLKIKGHSGDYWNERADRLAAYARVNKVSHFNQLPDYEKNRCTETIGDSAWCKLYANHIGAHHWTNKSIDAYAHSQS